MKLTSLTGVLDALPALGITGATRKVVVPVVVTRSGTMTNATGTFSLKRLAFQIGQNERANKFALTGVGKF